MTHEASTPMNLPPVKKEWNINTFILVAGFVLTLVMTGAGMLWTYSQFAWQINANTKSISDYKASTDVRIIKLESDTRQIDNLAYRISAAEGANASVTRSLDDLKAAVSEQSGDLKLMREILQRLERQSGQTAYSPALAVQ